MKKKNESGHGIQNRRLNGGLDVKIVVVQRSKLYSFTLSHSSYATHQHVPGPFIRALTLLACPRTMAFFFFWPGEPNCCALSVNCRQAMSYK